MKEILIGAHCSTEGGLHTCFERAEIIDATAIQIFTQNARQWHSSKIQPKIIEMYKMNMLKSKVKTVISHDSYLINLCAKDEAIQKKSEHAFKGEIIRCHDLGIKLLVFHPGSHLGQGEELGLDKVADALNRLHEATKECDVISVLETTAGQGTNLGYKFEHLKHIIDLIDNKERIGVCMDTCHIFAAGYDIRDKKSYKQTMSAFDEIIGFDYLRAVHLNDCKKECGSRVDRHEHIGKGNIGLDAFSFLMNDKRFGKIPKVLETEKSDDLHEDIENLTILKGLIQ
jgi:deoxyribonuclease-4